MSQSGESAEQVIRLSLEGVEVAARITGTAAKEVAVLLAALLKSGNRELKPKGKARLTSMLKSGKPLEIFSVKDADLKNFADGAKKYGATYCVLRNKTVKDGVCDVMVRAEDAPKISRLVERLGLATVGKAKIENTPNPTKATTAPPYPSAPISESNSKSERGATNPLLKTAPRISLKTRSSPRTLRSISSVFNEDKYDDKSSVKEQLRELSASKKANEQAVKDIENAVEDKPKKRRNVMHNQPRKSKKPKKQKSER